MKFDRRTFGKLTYPLMGACFGAKTGFSIGMRNAKEKNKAQKEEEKNADTTNSRDERLKLKQQLFRSEILSESPIPETVKGSAIGAGLGGLLELSSVAADLKEQIEETKKKLEAAEQRTSQD